MKRGGPLRRRTRLKPMSDKRRDALPVWRETKQRIMARDRDCVGRTRWPEVTCGGRFDVHHVLRKGQGGTDDDDNLVLLCRLHHDACDLWPEDAVARGLVQWSMRGGG